MAVEVNKIGDSFNRRVVELTCNKGDVHPNNTTNKTFCYIPNGSTLTEIGDDGELEVYFFNEALDKFILP